ncbi:MAG: hypothetical protein LIO75_03075 [Lachnospiraceae bacterium]|nr:hypothetical protein [Lachnospiraceae bacterium]
MSSKTRIVVLHMKEVVYTAVFIVLAIVLILLLVFMFGPVRRNQDAEETSLYKAGVYTSSIQLEGQTLDVQVVVDEDHINSVSLVNLDETIATMYPLLQESMDTISQQIYEEQSTENISYTVENQYTTSVLLDAVERALDKARTDEEEAGKESDADETEKS